MFNILFLLKFFTFFTGSYSNTVFPSPLSPEEEQKCIKLMKNGDKSAREKLIEHNLRLVCHIAKKFDNKTTDLDDLISIGTIGLIKGIDTFNEAENNKLTTYASRCIQNEILMFYRADKKNNNVVSLNDAIGFDKDGNEISIIDVIKDEKTNVTNDVIKNNYLESLETYYEYLTSREKEILKKRYGLFNTKSKTQKEIAKELKISRSYVSRIEKRAITKILRLFIKNKKI